MSIYGNIFFFFQFSLYDDAGHLVGFDWEMLDSREQNIFFCGYVKPLFDDSALAENGIPVGQSEKLTGWWLTGYGEGEALTIGITTEAAHYYLMAPCEDYKRIYYRIIAKAFVAKILIDGLYKAEDAGIGLTYSSLLEEVQSATLPHEDMEPLGADFLVDNASFLLSQVASFEDAGDDDEERFMANHPCIGDITEFTGSAARRRGTGPRIRTKQTKAPKVKMSQSKAVVTPAVLASFKRIFEGLIDDTEDKKSKTIRKRRCNICENCMKKDCGQCTHCKDMIKFGGTGKSKQACEKRACNNMVEKQFDNEVSDDEDEKIQETISTPKKEDEVDKENDNGKANLSDEAKLKNQMKIKDFTINLGEKLSLSNKTMKVATANRYSKDGFSFTKEPIGYISGRAVYDTVQVGKELWKQGDCVNHGRDIGQVVYFYQNKRDKFCAHLRMFLKGNETVLKEMADEHELFVSRECRRILLDQIEVSF